MIDRVSFVRTQSRFDCCNLVKVVPSVGFLDLGWYTNLSSLRKILFYFPSVSITSVYCHTQFIRLWASNPGFSACQTSTLPTKLHLLPFHWLISSTDPCDHGSGCCCSNFLHKSWLTVNEFLAGCVPFSGGLLGMLLMKLEINMVLLILLES